MKKGNKGISFFKIVVIGIGRLYKFAVEHEIKILEKILDRVILWLFENSRIKVECETVIIPKDIEPDKMYLVKYGNEVLAVRKRRNGKVEILFF